MNNKQKIKEALEQGKTVCRMPWVFTLHTAAKYDGGEVHMAFRNIEDTMFHVEYFTEGKWDEIEIRE